MASYELRLLDLKGKTQKVLRFESLSEDAAKAHILSVIDVYDRYELWRGMEIVTSGGRFIVASAPLPQPPERRSGGSV